MLKSKIFVISLKRALNRRKAISDSLSKLNLDFELIDAVDGRALSEDELQIVSKQTSFDLNLALGRKLHIDFEITKSEIGCALSHLKIYKKIVDDNIDYALILEDDCIVQDKIHNLLGVDGVEKYINKWDVVNLSSDCGLRTFIKHQLPINGQYKLENAHFNNYYLDSIFNRRRFFIMAIAYFIKKEACQKLLDIAYPIRYPADYLLGSPIINHLKIYKCIPSDVIGDMHAFESTLVTDESKRGTNFRLS